MKEQKKFMEHQAIRHKGFPETHQNGIVSIENLPDELECDPGHMKCDFGIHIASDGRVWICIDGIAFIRFSPHANEKMSKEV
jgi:hypothetical protein